MSLDGPSSAPVPWHATVLSLFPEMFPGPLAHSLAGKALARGVWVLDAVDIRASATDERGSVDDAPFGGGPGMVMRADVLDAALAALGDRARAPVVCLTPRGVPLDQGRIRDLAAGPGVTFVCARYEGVDQRLVEARGLEEMSVGDFVLSGGEPAALCALDACVRLLPGVVGTEGSVEEESFADGLLEYPHYTRPREWCGRGVPDVLLSGHHEQVRAWRLAEAERVTRERRPDLWARYLAARLAEQGRQSGAQRRKG